MFLLIQLAANSRAFISSGDIFYLDFFTFKIKSDVNRLLLFNSNLTRMQTVISYYRAA